MTRRDRATVVNLTMKTSLIKCTYVIDSTYLFSDDGLANIQYIVKLIANVQNSKA